MKVYKRYLHDSILAAMGHFPAILITGARQSGKSTLSMSLCENYITLEEIQKAPELLSAIKMAIDSDRRAGQFILTGSANVLDLKMLGIHSQVELLYLSSHRFLQLK